MLGIIERLNAIEHFKPNGKHRILTTEEKTILRAVKRIEKRSETDEAGYSSRGKDSIPVCNFAIRPVGNVCNFACRYCFTRIHKPARRYFETNMSIKLIERIMTQAAKYYSGRISMFWTGGEILLSNIKFLKEAIAIQKKIIRTKKHLKIDNIVHTNATLLNKEWAAFFKQNAFGVGISLDGPEDDHNRGRTYHDFSGTYKDVIRGIGILKQAKINFGANATILPVHKRNPEVFLKTFLDLGITRLSVYPSMDEKMLLSPKELADFMTGLFDAWLASSGRISVRNFDDILYSLIGSKRRTTCQHSGECGSFPCIEPNGDVWICDYPFTSDDYCLGNIADLNLPELFRSDKYKRFLKAKSEIYDRCSRSCAWFYVCRGDCLYRHTIRKQGFLAPKSYYCRGLSGIYEHVISKFDRIITGCL
ncbi:MAG: radical SAM protein [Candidatus Omnitrophota bacterium]|jgi:uncharacterized protein